jgi:hypothetical protein
MANRTYNQFAGTLERKVVKLFAKILWTDPGSGVIPTLVTSEVLNSSTSPITINPSQGFESLTDNGTGEFTLTLGANNGGVPTYDPYVRLLNVSMSAVGSGSPPTAAPIALVVDTDNVNGSSGNPSIDFLTVTVNGGTGAVSAGTAPDDGTIMYVELTLSNTTAY